MNNRHYMRLVYYKNSNGKVVYRNKKTDEVIIGGILVPKQPFNMVKVREEGMGSEWFHVKRWDWKRPQTTSATGVVSYDARILVWTQLGNLEFWLSDLLEQCKRRAPDGFYHFRALKYE